MKIAGGLKESGVVVGNTYDKYGSRNPIVRRIMRGFEEALGDLVARVSPESIHEIGCGEGYWVMQWTSAGIAARGSDFSEQVIALAKENARQRSLSTELFVARSIYDLRSPSDSADLLVCCEVLEHLDDPAAGLAALQRVATKHLILSVPREPIWCALNMARGKYWSSWGNTPGHVQHWSSGQFSALVSEYFDVLEVRSPLPWTMLLCKVRQQGHHG